MRIQKQITVPSGIGVGRAFVTVASRKNATTAEWTLRYLRNDARRLTTPGKLPAYRVAPPSR